MPARISRPFLMMATLSHSFFRYLQHVGGEEDGAARVADLAHHALEQVGRLGVKPDERFVHEDELRFVQPCGDDRQLLLHAV